MAIIQSSGLSLAEREGGEDKFLASLPLSQLLLLLMSNLTPCYPDIRNIFICLNTWGSFGREKYCLHNLDYSILCVNIDNILKKLLAKYTKHNSIFSLQFHNVRNASEGAHL